MNVGHFFFRNLAALLGHVHNLTCHHTGDPGTAGNGFRRTQPLHGTVFAGCTQHQLHSTMQQTIPCQNGHAFAKHHVIGRLAAAKIVIVHGRQVIMNQAVGMDHLQCAGIRHNGRKIHPHGIAHSQQKHRTKPLSACLQGVGHGFFQPLRHMPQAG